MDVICGCASRMYGGSRPLAVNSGAVYFPCATQHRQVSAMLLRDTQEAHGQITRHQHIAEDGVKVETSVPSCGAPRP